MYKTKLRPIVLAVAGVIAIISQAHAENKAEVMELGAIEVISTTPLPSLGTPLNQVPSNVQVGSSKEINQQ